MKPETFGHITLYNADCMDVMREMPDKAFDLAIVDPPYGKKPMREPGKDAGEGFEERIQKRDKVRKFNQSDNLRGNATDTQDNGCGPRSCKGCKISKRVILSGKQERGTVRGSVDRYNSKRIAPHASRAELQRGKQYRGVEGTGEIENKGGQPCRPICGKWEKFPTQSPVCGRDDGIPGELDGITLPSWRRESLKAYGNAVVPLVPLQIFNAINQYEKNSILL